MIVDGVNILTQYGAVMSEDSIDNIVSYPSLKSPETNDWAEETGIEVDLSSPLLDKKSVEISMLCNSSSVNDFVDFLRLKTYRIYEFSELGCTYKLRFSGISNFKYTDTKSSFILRLIDDLPLFNYVSSAPSLNAVDYGFMIDGTNINTFGVNIIEGTLDSLNGFSNIKNRLEIDNKLISGVKVFETEQFFSEYTAKLKCFMKQDVADFWIGYNGLLHTLIQPNLRTLVVNGSTYKFYYKSSKVVFFNVIKGKIFCEFEIEIVVV